MPKVCNEFPIYYGVNFIIQSMVWGKTYSNLNNPANKHTLSIPPLSTPPMNLNMVSGNSEPVITCPANLG